MNRISLTVGIVKYEPGWEIVLEQIGVSWKVIESYDASLSEQYSVIIHNAVCDTVQTTALNQFLVSGGSILSVFGSSEQLLSIKSRTTFFDFLPPLHLGYATTTDILDVHSYGKVLTDKHSISLHQLGNGTIINIPFDVNTLLTQTKRKRKNFYFGAQRLPNEIVSAVSKNQLRTLITSSLEYLHHCRRLPFVHKWYFPNTYPTIFTFRIDTDRGSQEEIEGLFQLSETYHIPATWFLDVKSHEQWLPYFQKFTNQETGIHCYEHTTYDSVERNRKNFEQASRLMNENSLTCYGVAAPRGNWSSALGTAFEQLQFLYSSEFSYDYDNLPSYPWLNDHFSSVVQLPVHPICPGTLRRAGYTAKQQTEYFLTVINKKIAAHEPICFFHHPTHHYNDVFEEIFKYIQEQQIPAMLYRDYAEWWKRRSKSKQEVAYDTASRKIHTTGKPDNVWFHITTPQQKETIVALHGEMLLESLPLKPTQQAPDIPSDIMRARKFDFRHPLIDLFEFYFRLKQ